MIFVAPHPVPTPADAERLMSTIWELTKGTRVGLCLLGAGDSKVYLGVTSDKPWLEERVARCIQDVNEKEDVTDVKGSELYSPITGGMFENDVLSAQQLSVFTINPTNRHLEFENKTFGWQRTDPLREAYRCLERTPNGCEAGVIMCLRPMQNLRFQMSLIAFATGMDARERAHSLAACYSGIGSVLAEPWRKHYILNRAMNGQLRKMASIPGLSSAKRVEVACQYWHPPFAMAMDSVKT